ncbi:MAG: hypothetical protein M0R48_08970 [Candidatus Omnitrophica bacterium]|nr:hypothetical protein [Candidatus Omnitrophota bacterium]
MEKSKLYIVVAIDTEGPASYALDSWDKIDKMMKRITSDDFRYAHTDSYSEGLRYSYFVMDWTAFSENPNKRVFGYSAIYEHYLRDLFAETPLKKHKDGVYWHYHHPCKDGKWRYGGWNETWGDNNEYENQINHLIIDRQYFPNIYRAGGTIETNEQSQWLEEWIPFDFSSRGPESISLKSILKKLKNNICGNSTKYLWDWSRAPRDWIFYTPSAEDYQLKGTMARKIFRCAGIKSDEDCVNSKYIKEAFLFASKRKEALFSFFTHDFYVNADQQIYNTAKLIKSIAKDFDTVEYAYLNALDAAQKCLCCEDKGSLGLTVSLDSKILIVKSNKKLFSKQPWLSAKFIDLTYKHILMQQKEETLWTVDLPLDKIEILGVGACDKVGNSTVTLTRIL